MKKPKIKIKNGLRDSKGVLFGDAEKNTGKIRINVKHRKHKDPAELASTIKHEIMHVRHPKMTEKEVYKRTTKTKIPKKEQKKLLKKVGKKFNAGAFEHARRSHYKLNQK